MKMMPLKPLTFLLRFAFALRKQHYFQQESTCCGSPSQQRSSTKDREVICKAALPYAADEMAACIPIGTRLYQ